MCRMTTTKNGITLGWDKHDGYLWNGKRTFDKRKIATIKRALFPTLDESNEGNKMNVNTPMEMAGFYSIAKITGDNRHMGEHDDGYLVYYNYNLRYGYQGCASFPTLDEAKAFAASKIHGALSEVKEGNKMNEYTITIGEVGNEIGHATTAQYATDADAIKAAKKAVAPYNGDGWYKVTCQGQTVAKSKC